MDMMVAPSMRVPCPLCDGTSTAFERHVAGFALDRCRDCGHVFMNPQFSTSEIDALYVKRDVENLAGIYSRIAASESIRQEYGRRLDVLESMVPSRGRLLDFACGAGAFFELAQARGWDAHGTELGEWAGEAAKSRGLKNLHVGTLSTLQFQPGSFDVVYAAQVFEHLPRPTVDLGEIKRILKPGGLLYIDVPNYRTLSIVLGRDDFMLNEPPQHLNYFRPTVLAAMLRSAGFEVSRVSSAGGLKWENVIGRSIKSEIKDAYGLGEGGRATGSASPQRPLARSASPSMLKQAALTTVVKPLLYERLKLGMLLMAFARKPAN